MQKKIQKWLVIVLLPVLLLTIISRMNAFGSNIKAEEIGSRQTIPAANKYPLTVAPQFKPITPGVVVSVPAEYTFQPKATMQTTVKVMNDTGDVTPPRGTWTKGFNRASLAAHPYVIATHMGILYNKWVDVKLIPLSTKNATDGFYIGLNKDNDGSVGLTARESLFTVSDTADSEPKLTMQFIDHETGAPIKVPGGHITYSDIDNDEWMNFSIGSGIDGIYSWNTTKLKGDINHTTSTDFTISSEGLADVPETNKNYWFTVTYNETSSIDLQFNARQSGIAFGYHEFDELMFELSNPNKIGDTDGNVTDEAITYSIYQDVPYRSGLTAISKFTIEDSIPAALDIVSVNVFNNSGLDVTSRFTDKTIGNQIVLEGNAMMLANTAKDTYRVDIKTKLNKNENYMQYYNTAIGQLVIPNTATTKYTNSPNNESFVLNSPTAYGHIKMDIPNTPPIISLDKKKDESTGNAYTVTGKWRDTDSDAVMIFYTVDGSSKKLGQLHANPNKGVDQPFTFEIPASELPLGNHTIQVFAEDAEGLISNIEELVLIPPNTPPIISLDKNKDISTGNAYTVTGKWRDKDSESVVLMYSVDGGPNKLGKYYDNPNKGTDQPFTFEIPASELPLGDHTIKVFAEDVEGLTSNIEELLLVLEDSTVKVYFVNDDGDEIEQSIELPSKVKDELDLKTVTQVQEVVTKLTTTDLYDLLSTPPNDQVVIVKPGGNEVTYTFFGKMSLTATPTMTFETGTVTSKQQFLSYSGTTPFMLNVNDKRGQKVPVDGKKRGQFQITGSLTTPFTHSETHATLLSAQLMYNDGTDSQEISASGVSVFDRNQVSPDTAYPILLSEKDNTPQEKGLSLLVPKGSSLLKGTYNAEITWDLIEGP